MALSSGEVIDNRYRIVKLLGQGGMGAVYRAWDMRLEKPIALKEMVPQFNLGDEMLAGLREQFRQEAQILATLVHPNLVRVTDYFSWDGKEYLVMDFVEGENLAERIARGGAQPEAQVLEWAGQLLAALGYCHKRGVIHRDIKPQNIIITPEGQAVLVDFGLVKLWDPSAPETRTVMRGAGTPEYAPPEQYDMGAGHTDQRSDVYSVGATLYHALTGQVPPTATQRMASPSSFMSPRRINVELSPGTEAAVLKALEMAMEARYQSTEEMAQGLGTAPQPAVIVPPRAKPEREEPAPAVKEAVPARRGILWGMGGASLAIIAVLCLGVTLVVVLAALGAFGGGESPTATPTHTALPPTDTPLSPTDTSLPSTDTPPPPTATPLPTMTPVPVSGLLLDENFSNPDSGWEVDDSADGDVGYGDGYYYVLAEAEGIQMFGFGPHIFSNLVIDVYTTQIASSSDNVNAYGVMCRVQRDGDGYLLRISGDGQYAIQRVLDDNFEYLVEWTDSAAINQGNALNHIHAVCDGTRLALYANGELLAEAEDDTFAEGDIGLTATTFGSVATEVHFDNLIVLEPDSILIRDDFSNPESGWDVEEFEGGSLGYKEGVYVIRAEDSDYYYLGQTYVSLADVAIEVDATQILGPANDDNYYGSGCRLQSDGAGYLFIISGQGYYAIYREEGEAGGEFLVDWTESDVIRQGNATNHLRAICDGTRLAIAINGELLAEVEDDTYATGDVLLVASTLEDGATEVHFDDLLVYVP
ncbi:MAG: protein kinase [Anaerolineae bacterium]|nr:protein kinase [Anaerolineae bacterium]